MGLIGPMALSYPIDPLPSAIQYINLRTELFPGVKLLAKFIRGIFQAVRITRNVGRLTSFPDEIRTFTRHHRFGSRIARITPVFR